MTYFVQWLRANLNASACEALDDDYEGHALSAWLDDIDPDTGYIEIPARMSRTGNLVTSSFPELAENVAPSCRPGDAAAQLHDETGLLYDQCAAMLNMD